VVESEALQVRLDTLHAATRRLCPQCAGKDAQYEPAPVRRDFLLSPWRHKPRVDSPMWPEMGCDAWRIHDMIQELEAGK